jgi:hypothetical protein
LAVQDSTRNGNGRQKKKLIVRNERQSRARARQRPFNEDEETRKAMMRSVSKDFFLTPCRSMHIQPLNDLCVVPYFIIKMMNCLSHLLVVLPSHHSLALLLN